MKNRAAINDLLRVMARLRSPTGCPWDREQTHRTLRFHAVEEAYELIDAIETGDDHEMLEELGDLLLQVIFHCQLAQERGAFVEVFPGKDGLVHISELADFRVKRTEDVAKMGDMIWVKCIGIDDKGRVKLSRKAALKERAESETGQPAPAPAEAHA